MIAASAGVFVVASSLLTFSFLFFVGVHMLRHLVRLQTVDLQAISAAVCYYLLVGLNWSFIYLLEEIWQPGSFRLPEMTDVGEYFDLDSVNLKIDGKEVANYLYTQREVDALVRGGVHRVHMENLKVGEHELVAVFTGEGPHIRDYRRGATINIEKGIGAKYVELEITDKVTKQQPEFVIKEWE